MFYLRIILNTLHKFTINKPKKPYKKLQLTISKFLRFIYFVNTENKSLFETKTDTKLTNLKHFYTYSVLVKII